MVALLRKELSESWRTRRLLVLAVAFLFFGLLSPITAKLTPDLLEMLGTSTQGVVIQVPTPTVGDAMLQYVKNLSQLLPLVVLLVAFGTVVGERERGTMPMLLAKPVDRGGVLGAKFLAQVVGLLLALALGALAAYYYTRVLFGGLDLGAFVAMNAIAAVYLLVVLSLTFMASVLGHTTVRAAALAIVLWLALSIVGALPWIGRASPTTLLEWATRLGVGQAPDGEWTALAVSAAVVVVSLALAWLSFRRQEF